MQVYIWAFMFRKYLLIFILIWLSNKSFAQSVELFEGDTINLTLMNGKKQGFWRYFWSNGDL